MRPLPLILLALPLATAQFRSTVPLVVAPVTVTDAKGRFIDGLTEKELVLYDNNVPQPIRVDEAVNPISLVVLIQASSNSAANLAKFAGSGVLFTDLLSGDAGETAVVSFSDRPKLVQDFTADSRALSRGLRNLRVQGNGAALLDGLRVALDLVFARGWSRRKVILVAAERRDRSSAASLADLLRDAQRQNVIVYWLTYSAFLAPFTARPRTVWDTMTDEQKANPDRGQGSIKYPLPEEQEPLPPEMAPGSLLSIFTELKNRSQVDLAALFTRTTGGRTFNFLKRSGLESAIQAVGEEVHRQYVVTFQPKQEAAAGYHTLRAGVRGQAGLEVRTRAGYWRVE